MTLKEFQLEYALIDVKLSELQLAATKRNLEQGYLKLESEYVTTLQNLIFNLEELQSEKAFKESENPLKPSEIAILALKIKRAEALLELGKKKANAELEVAYNNLKLEVSKKEIFLERERIYLEFAKAEKERGFTL